MENGDGNRPCIGGSVGGESTNQHSELTFHIPGRPDTTLGGVGVIALVAPANDATESQGPIQIRVTAEASVSFGVVLKITIDGSNPHRLELRSAMAAFDAGHWKRWGETVEGNAESVCVSAPGTALDDWSDEQCLCDVWTVHETLEEAE